MVRRLERDLPELLSFFAFPRHLWRKLRTTNVIERCFVEVRRRTRPMVCFVNVGSVDRIIYSIFQRIQPGVENPHPLRIYTSGLTSPGPKVVDKRRTRSDNLRTDRKVQGFQEFRQGTRA